MAVNIGVLKQDKIRKKISIIIDRKEEIVTVFNALGSERDELLKTWDELIVKGTEEDSIVELTKQVLLRLTDLEIGDDVDMKYIIENPTTEMSLILHEVNEIVSELLTQFWTSKIRDINQTTIMLLTAHATKRTEVMTRLTTELEESKKSYSEVEKELNGGVLDLPVVKAKKKRATKKAKK